jgi:phospholipid-binding lipoprotein MlaA
MPLAASAESADPWEKLNRKTFAVNDFFDRILIKPIATGYTKVVPRFARRGVHNALANFGTPIVALNQLLQGKGKAALSDTGRFAVNTTLGLGGLFDPATNMGMVAHNEDFGQTLQTWGLAPGPHVVLPLRGSTTVTDAFGSLVGTFTNPALLFQDTQTRVIITGVSLLDLRAELLSAETLVSGDRYLFLRDALLQRRQFLVNDGKVDEDPFLSDDFDDDAYDEDEDWEIDE